MRKRTIGAIVCFGALSLRLLGCGAFTAASTNANVDGSTLDAPESTDAGGERPVRTSIACPALGLDPASAWPTMGGCVTREGRTPFRGPATRPVEVWVNELDAGFEQKALGSPVLTGTGLLIYGRERDSEGLVALNKQDGTVAWLGQAGNVSEPPSIAADGTIIVGSGTTDTGIIAFHPDGGRRWHTRRSGEHDTSPLIADNGNIFAGGLDTQDIFGMGEAGGILWNRGHADPRSFSLARDGTLVFTVGGGALIRIDRSPAGRWNVPAGVEGPGEPVINDDTIYVTGVDGKLASFDLETGARKWIFDPGSKGLRKSRPAIGADRTIFIGTESAVVAVHPNNQEKWRFPTGGLGVTHPVVDAAGHVFFVASQEGHTGQQVLFAVGADGQELWRMPLIVGNGIAFIFSTSQPIIDEGGTLYVLTAYGRVHAFRAP